MRGARHTHCVPLGTPVEPADASGLVAALRFVFIRMVCTTSTNFVGCYGRHLKHQHIFCCLAAVTRLDGGTSRLWCAAAPPHTSGLSVFHDLPAHALWSLHVTPWGMSNSMVEEGHAAVCGANRKVRTLLILKCVECAGGCRHAADANLRRGWSCSCSRAL